MAMRFEEIDRNAALALLARPEYRKTVATLSSKARNDTFFKIRTETDVYLTQPLYCESYFKQL